MHTLFRNIISRKFPIVLLCLVCFAGSYAQTATKSYGRVDVEITKEKKPKRIYAKVEIKSAFTGGDSAWIHTLEQTLNQTLIYKNGAKPGKYMVSVAFITDKDGFISDIRNLSDPGYGMGEKVIIAIKRKTVWRPARQPATVRELRVTYLRSMAKTKIS